MNVNIVLLNDKAKMPFRENSTDAGADLYITEGAIIQPKKRATLKTGLALEIPIGYYGRVAPRSKLANNYGLDVLAGVVDCTYRGEVMVSLFNSGDDVVELQPGDKAAQLIIEKIALPTFTVVEYLSETVRGTSGINDSELRLR